jgi:C4-dicarboxylate-specific signal transduction histidine kinase
LLGSLATAGIAALAYEHEANKQLHELEALANQLSSMSTTDTKAKERLKTLTATLTDWIQRTRSNRSLFSHLLDEESRETKIRLKAAPTVQQIVEQTRMLLRGVRVDTSGIDDRLRLPKASFAEWAAILQNVLINAGNAMLDSKRKLIAVRSTESRNKRSLLVEDTGCGVDIETSNELFEPFVRKLKLSAERKALGLGGAGLGLAIVRMIADSLGCDVSFVKPSKDFSTTFRLSWSETE